MSNLFESREAIIRPSGTGVRKLGSMVCFTLLAVSSLHANLILNGQFTAWTGSGPNNWIYTPAASGSFGINENVGGFGAPPLGGNYANVDSVGSNPGAFPADYDELSQTIATTPGNTYSVSFYLAANADSYFQAYFGGNQLLNIVTGSGQLGWTLFSYSVPASSPSSTLAFYGINVPAWIGVSDVDVEQTTVVPEPSTFVAGLSLLAPFAASLLRWPGKDHKKASAI